jgi:hypothetical protein
VDADLAECFFFAMPVAASASEGRQNVAVTKSSAAVASLDKYDTSTFADTVGPV